MSEVTTSKNTQHNDEDFEKLDDREHALRRPDMYVGETEKVNTEEWIFNDSTGMMEYKLLEYSPAAVKVVDEILVNARDANIKDDTVTKIQVDVDELSGMITIANNGNGIPVKQMEKWDGQYLIEGLFGSMRCSSSFKDDVKRTWGGKFGLGAKCTNIYSSYFCVESKDTVNKKQYKQEWRNNMGEQSEPLVKKYSAKPSGTTVSFILDWQRLNMTGLEKDFVEIIKRRTYDIAACTSENVNVYWNGARIMHKNFDKYMDLFIGSARDEKRVMETLENTKKNPAVPNMTWNIGACLSRNSFRQVSIVNGIWTKKGGSHVNYIRDMIVRKVKAYLNEKKNKEVQTSHIREHLFLFVNATVVNPKFNSQTKEELTESAGNFEYKCSISDQFIEGLIKKCGLGDYVLKYSEFQEQQDLTKVTDGSKRGKLDDIPNFEDAKYAGTRYSKNCTLVITEGISAKTLAISGFSVVGRDNWGVFPLKGKPLNVRNATLKQLSSNKEYNYFKQILGLEDEKVYTSVDQLRYGRLMFMADQDLDGSHIKGLLMNMIHTFWPSLMELVDENGNPFIAEFRTPIVTATPPMGNKKLVKKEFFALQDFEVWRNTADNVGKYRIKYIKGLGGNEPIDAKRYFANKDDYIVYYYSKNPEITNEVFDKAFHEKKANLRKTWLIDEYDYNKVRDQKQPKISYDEFVNLELVHYFKYDLSRSVGNVIDGLKTSQRKVFYACRKKNVKDDIKVFQLAGAVAEISAYHHGDASLHSTIIGMAQNFAGSNNINILFPAGQFGSRVEKGKDASAPRYINTRFEDIMNIMFPAADDVLLQKKKDDDGNDVEPVHYVPILPMILINGCDGIGTGFSTQIPGYNPTDVINNIYAYLNGKPLTPLSPWYRDFEGEIKNVAPNKFETKGIIKYLDEDTIRVSELPIGTNKCKSFKKYMKFLTESVIKPGEKSAAQIKKQFIKSFENNYTDEKADFLISFPNAAFIDKLNAKSKIKFSKAKTLHEMKYSLSTSTGDDEIDEENDEEETHVLSVAPASPPITPVAQQQPSTIDNTPNDQELYKKLNLVTTINTSNMYLFDENDNIAKYSSAEHILTHFCKIRLEFYEKRRIYYLQELEIELQHLSAKIKFLELIMQNQLVIFKADTDLVIKRLKELNFPVFEPENNYNYLLTMQINRFTTQEIEKLVKTRTNQQLKYDELKSKTSRDLWIGELDELCIQLKEWEKSREVMKEEYRKLNELGKKKRRNK